MNLLINAGILTYINLISIHEMSITTYTYTKDLDLYALKPQWLNSDRSLL
ncbi:sensor histidine kinase [Sediminispirochaeta smaragdinae DSM 11293]|uniref:Sensor histidine kinase n=1 Tax=Sediminispirochaeta smaragdinae (strain DSM 11293 / JCM 15392 / SEBR 4228) TaxID=573413 RepID=E1R894_SEDSS|nr:sensor histidine kinase [Sediminispirochaeta smaragdinae DSM 11293]